MLNTFDFKDLDDYVATFRAAKTRGIPEHYTFSSLSLMLASILQELYI